MLAAYARIPSMTQRPAIPIEDTGSYAARLAGIFACGGRCGAGVGD